MSNSVAFNRSVIGASHIKSGKPCQDYSISFSDEKVKILVVCDGHGGASYFRSDIGAKLAASVCLETLQKFADSIPADYFNGISYAITAKPQKNPFIDPDGNRLRFEDLDDTQKQYAKQAQAYIDAECKCEEQQALINQMLADIYTEWKYRIREDLRLKPFNSQEGNLIASNNIEKAYGCTMLAYLQTQSYWLAFQIGDGQIYVCDKGLNWKTPVPEDCNCFLNYTTSLCDNNPLFEFRYAFNGKGLYPLAVMLCSDGVDGSLRSQENITDFYEQIIGLYIDGDNIEAELESYLPQLSEMGNKDDISVAGVIDISTINPDNIKYLLELKKESRRIQTEFRTRKQELEAMSSRLDSLRIKFERHKDTRFMRMTELDEIRLSLKDKEASLIDLDKLINETRNEIEQLEKTITERTLLFEDWKFNIKNQMADIEAKQNEAIGINKGEGKQNYTNW